MSTDYMMKMGIKKLKNETIKFKEWLKTTLPKYEEEKLSPHEVNLLTRWAWRAWITAISTKENNDIFNYVDVISPGNTGWLNLFIDDDCVALVTNKDALDKIRQHVKRRTTE